MSDKDKYKNLTTVNSICSVINVSGNNVIGFLNNLLISYLPKLEKNSFHYSALCNPKGRIIASMWINILNNHEMKIICPTNMSQFLIDFLNQRKFRLKLEIQLIKESVIVDKNTYTIRTIEKKHSQINDVDSFYDLMFSKNLPWIGKDNSEKFIPQHVNLDLHENIMSFTKGCYPGQEIIARLKYLGKIKKRMELFTNKNRHELSSNVINLEQVSSIVQIQSSKLYYVQAIINDKQK